MNNVNAKSYVNTKINKTLKIEDKSYYTEEQQHIPFSTVIKYSSNSALFFFVISNVFSNYYINTYHNKTNQKYIYTAISLYLIQIIYNYLDINDKTNLSRLQMHS